MFDAIVTVTLVATAIEAEQITKPLLGNLAIIFYLRVIWPNIWKSL